MFDRVWMPYRHISNDVREHCLKSFSLPKDGFLWMSVMFSAFLNEATGAGNEI
jgi:hypothetical protein